MKSPLLRAFAGLLLLWTVADLSYRAGLNAARSKSELQEKAAQAPLSSSTPALPGDTEIRVLVMPNGALYHNASCKKVKGGTYIPFSEARRLGYTACLSCGG